MIDPVHLLTILDNPFGRLVKFLPPLQRTRDELTQMGLFEVKDDKLVYTPAGLVAHWLACDVNPRRRSYRTGAAIVREHQHSLIRKCGATEVSVYGVVARALNHLHAQGLTRLEEFHPEPLGRVWALVI